MVRRIILYLSITLGFITQIAILDNDLSLASMHAGNLQNAAVVPAAESSVEPAPAIPLPTGEFLSPHAKVSRSGRDSWILDEEFVYVDSIGKKWVAPAGTITDGASIPQVFLSATGERLDGDYIDAAVIHDAYCQNDNLHLETYQQESWQYVHYMFYEALLTSGVPEQKAQIMYTAVYLGGPRWGDDTALVPDIVVAPTQNGRSVEAPNLLNEPTQAEIDQFLAVVEWIETENPTGEELQSKLESQ
ncbi:MAG: DUF1353 domain-containing protein [Chloroflexota bacterium]